VPALRDALQPEGALVEVRLSWSTVHVRRLRQALQPVPQPLDCRALLDTGAEITCADTSLIQQLGLPLAQITLANVPALGGLRAGAHYHGGLTLIHPSGDARQNLLQPNMIILEVPLAVIGYQILIGRDVLDRCDFLYSGRRGRFTLAY
jgi:hypothetical protein